jgi:DNA-binding CsgD family transcriptional regulator
VGDGVLRTWAAGIPDGALSARETQVLDLASQGFTNIQVARTLDVSVHAVKFHLASVYRKLGVANRTEAAAVYLRSRRFLEAGMDGEPPQ